MRKSKLSANGRRFFMSGDKCRYVGAESVEQITKTVYTVDKATIKRIQITTGGMTDTYTAWNFNLCTEDGTIIQKYPYSYLPRDIRRVFNEKNRWGWKIDYET